jgi:putative ABC transport system substrate-binding protein
MKALAIILTAAVSVFLSSPRMTEGQPSRKIPIVGVLSFSRPPSEAADSPQTQALRQGLRDLGYVEGQTIILERLYSERREERLSELSNELVRLKIQVIVVGGPAAVKAVRNATKTIPIVMVSGADPVAEGLAASFARPGGNLTGLTVSHPSIGEKRLQLLAEAVPGLARAAMLWDSTAASPSSPASRAFRNAMDAAANALAVKLHLLEVSGPDDFEPALRTAIRERAQGLLVFETAMVHAHRARLADLAVKNRLPAIGVFRESAEAGYLMAYGTDLRDLYRRAAGYVDKILKGTKAGDLPIERPAKFELTVNTKTARALKLAIPEQVLLRADRVIQ